MDNFDQPAYFAALHDPSYHVAFASGSSAWGRTRDHGEADRAIELEQHVHVKLLKDILGNPFRPVALNPRWRTETVVALATGIYQERAFDRMPILVDALEDAGCDHADILSHCRGAGPHVRGCWVVDLLLGKQ